MNKLISVSIGILLVAINNQASAIENDWNKLLKEVESENPQFFTSIVKGKKNYKIKKDGLTKAGFKSKKKERRHIRKLSRKLLKATRQDDYEKVKEYILAGADPKYSRKNGETSLHIAAARGNIKIVRVLETHGADINATTIKDWTPLHHAARFGHLEVVRYLMSKGANMYFINSDGKNPYILARQIKHNDIIQYLQLWRKYH